MPPHILVITDDDDNRALLIRLLQSQGQRVAVAADGQEALEHLSHQVFSLILIDLDGADPDVRGFEILRQLHQHATVRNIPVAVIAGAGDLDLIARCIELGADDYLLKPFNEVLLRARIHALLERKAWRDHQRAFPEDRRVRPLTQRQRLHRLLAVYGSRCSMLWGAPGAINAASPPDSRRSKHGSRNIVRLLRTLRSRSSTRQSRSTRFWRV